MENRYNHLRIEDGSVEATSEASTPEVQEETKEDVCAEVVELEDKKDKEEAALKEVREKLGLPTEPADLESVETRDINEKLKKAESREDMEDFSSSLKDLSGNVEELQSAISRNKFPRVKFDSESISRVAQGETLDKNDFAGRMDDLSRSINKMNLPEDPRDRMELEPRNFRSVIEGIDSVEGSLVKLRSSLEEAKADNYEQESQQVGLTLNRLRKKKDGFEDGMSALQRIKK